MQQSLPSIHFLPRERVAPVPLEPPAWLSLFTAPVLQPAEKAGAGRTGAHPHAGRRRGGVRPQRHRGGAGTGRSGDVALGYRSADGVFRIERPVRGPAWLDQSSAWLDETHAMDARACTDVVLVELPCDVLKERLDRYPGLAQHLVTSLAREVRSLSMNTHELMHKDAPARFAAWLVQRVEATGPGRASLHLNERKRDIASQLAITPETLSRLMRSLTRQGVISVAGYTVQVLDMAALQRVAAGL